MVNFNTGNVNYMYIATSFDQIECTELAIYSEESAEIRIHSRHIREIYLRKLYISASSKTRMPKGENNSTRMKARVFNKKGEN